MKAQGGQREAEPRKVILGPILSIYTPHERGFYQRCTYVLCTYIPVTFEGNPPRTYLSSSVAYCMYVHLHPRNRGRQLMLALRASKYGERMSRPEGACEVSY